MRFISVIGGAGFIGTRLVERLLLANYDLRVIDNAFTGVDGFRYYGDVCKEETLMNAIAEGSVIVNLAAEHRDDVRPLSKYYDVNVKGAENVCKVAERRNVNKIIFTSSVAVYGFKEKETGEEGEISPFNDYGKSKWEAECVYREWQKKDPENRTLIVIRPTVVFGEYNRGNVFNLFKQIASGKFIMVGVGKNRKSMAYVENVAAFIEFSLSFKCGSHTFNYVDKPDFSMNDLVSKISCLMGREERIAIRIPYFIGLGAGYLFDCLGMLSGKQMSVSAVRVKKFCASTQFSSSVKSVGFEAPVSLQDGLSKTIEHEFLGNS